MKRNKLPESQLQNSNSVSRYNEQMSNLLKKGVNNNQNIKGERSVSRETNYTTIGNSRIFNRDSDQKSLEKNLQLQMTKIQRVEPNIEQNFRNSITIHQDKKRKQKEKVENKKQNEDNSNSHHELAIEDNSNNQCPTNQLLSIVGYDYLHPIQDRNSNSILSEVQKVLSVAQKNLKRFEDTPSSIRIKAVLAQQKIFDYENCKFSYRNERVLPEIRPLSKFSQQEINQIICISINFDSEMEFQDRKPKDKYHGTTQFQRIKQLCRRIQHLMKCGVDFIFLQQVYSKQLRRQLLKTIKKFNKTGKQTYSYPQNLEYKDEFQATMILTKHNVNFGQLQFKIKNPKTKKFMKLPQQAFCEFNAIIDEKDEKVCFLSYHLKSNRGFEQSNAFASIRCKQIAYLKDFGKFNRYHRFICVGDTNIGGSKGFQIQNLFLRRNFYDANDYGLSQDKGSFLFVHKQNNQVTNEKLDKVLIDLRSAATTLTKIKTIDLLLKSCKHKNLDRIKILLKDPKNHQQITLTDHSILEIRIRFTSL